LSRRLSPVPYFPSNAKDLPLILKALELKNKHIICDLGAGDGIVIFEAARKAYTKKLSTKFVAIEINPVLVLVMHIRRLFHPNRRNIRIILADMFTFDYSTMRQFSNVTMYMYVSPWLIKKLFLRLKKTQRNFILVSYFYEVSTLKPVKTWRGVHDIFIYRVRKKRL
jgi:16S rRNA A1518/A1519 N6-dimethyltransferase RsmA/KsgA/DIM1 with predicted DNA glycosylase/AP lyase activity